MLTLNTVTHKAQRADCHRDVPAVLSSAFTLANLVTSLAMPPAQACHVAESVR